MQVHMQQDGMKAKLYTVVLIILLTISMCTTVFTLTSYSASVLPKFYVDDDYNSSTPGWDEDHFDKIQNAINAAFVGDRIVVYAGTYYERLIIDATKESLSIFGEDKDMTIIDGGGNGDVITIEAPQVALSTFTIRNSGTNENNAMIKITADSCEIIDNNVIDGEQGISIEQCGSHKIYYNIIQSNNGCGISLEHSNDNEIFWNTITANANGIFFHDSSYNELENYGIQDNTVNGIFFNSTCKNNNITNTNISENIANGIFFNDHCSGNIIKNNQIYSNGDSGIRIENSSSTTVFQNIVNSNTMYGVMIVGSENIINESTINSNGEHGVFLFADDKTSVVNNTVAGNTKDGIRLQNSTRDNVSKNEISGNTRYGVYLNFYAINNTIYNNYFHENTYNALDISKSKNNWNVIEKNRKNIVGGPYLCGNYWDDYDEVSEGAIDNGHGIADEAYPYLYGSNTDNGPILDVIKPSIGTPQASPSSQTLGKYTNISVTITDNTKIKDVYLNIIDPSGQRNNFSITQNKTGDKYNCNKQFSPTGNYTYYIAAKDPRNWSNSSNYTFYIHPGNPPTIKDNSRASGSPSQDFTFNATVTSKDVSVTDLRVYVVWIHGANGSNLSLVNSQGNFFTGKVTLAHSIANLTYHFYATDKWGNYAVTENKKVKITDTRRPVIRINRYGPSFEDLPSSYTFGVTVTDDSLVSTVTIEYWYGNHSKMKVDMDAMGNNYYKKVIVPEGNPDRIYCEINASDIAGNFNDTKKPVACHGGPYRGFVLEEIKFNGTGSFDLDGTISQYIWNFGDGTTGNGITATHTYYSNGTYTITLTVIDNEGKNGTNRTSICVGSLERHKIPVAQLDLINERYNTTLTEQMFCYDSDGDGVVDTFVDPNHVLTAVHDRPVNLSGNIVFLLSRGDDSVPEFFWNITTDRIFSISHNIGIVKNIIIDDANEQATVYVTVDKDQWIYIEVDDQYPNSPVTIKTANRIISSDKIWREQKKIYVFDDPETEYQFIFDSIFPPLTVQFSPSDQGGIITGDNPTIHITYNDPVTIIYATFNSTDIVSELISIDDKNFTYTPPGYLENGSYYLEISAQALKGNRSLSSTVMYFYISYELPPQKSFLEKNWLTIVLGGFLGGLGALLIFFRVKHVSIDGFIYLKNRKIIPFFKPVIVGPVSVRIPAEHLSKAEFYVDGQLKDETTTFPALWQWNEKAFMKHTLETKVYDQEGNISTSGAMEFYIFNLSKNKQN